MLLLQDHQLLRQHIHCSLFYLGEYVNTEQLVEENVLNKVAVSALLGTQRMDVHISVDPTQIGYQLDPSMAERNALKIAQAIQAAAGNAPGVHCLMFDMEDASVTSATIAMHDSLQQEKYPVALTLQAYLKRTQDDMLRQIERGSRVRLVKGAFAASNTIAFTRQADIKANYRKLVEMMLSQRAHEAGFYPIIATHDDRIHSYAIKLAKQNGWAQGTYEFEMLLGVRSEIALQLAGSGERIRIYVPFGRDWWPHAVRRIGENPRNAVLLARSLVS